MTPEAPRSAIPITTLIIIFFPHDGLPEAIIMPHTIIKTNETIKITVTNIFVKLDIKTGKASSVFMAVGSFEDSSSIQLPMNGTEVLSSIPQQTPGSEQGLHTPSTSLVPVGQEQRIPFHTHHFGLEHSVHFKPSLTC